MLSQEIVYYVRRMISKPFNTLDLT
jgi:hypothetical protein